MAPTQPGAGMGAPKAYGREIYKGPLSEYPNAATVEALSFLWGISELLREDLHECGHSAHVWGIKAV